MIETYKTNYSFAPLHAFKVSFVISYMHRKNCKLTVLYRIVLLVTYFGLFAASTIQSYTLTAYSQNQNSSFVAEINSLNHISVQKSKWAISI